MYTKKYIDDIISSHIIAKWNYVPLSYMIYSLDLIRGEEKNFPKLPLIISLYICSYRNKNIEELEKELRNFIIFNHIFRITKDRLSDSTSPLIMKLVHILITCRLLSRIFQPSLSLYVWVENNPLRVQLFTSNIPPLEVNQHRRTATGRKINNCVFQTGYHFIWCEWDRQNKNSAKSRN